MKANFAPGAVTQLDHDTTKHLGNHFDQKEYADDPEGFPEDEYGPEDRNCV